ncbi:hypothetical protein IFM89_007252 [Coptis chinensis]|uniref:Glycosyl transferase family 51 domain-containing protein n=1 Tax=Coptis chinensis TaxID=261450 RepID=A0A835ILP3_9MAGN|nr:hypothetical protein IFM89_007252 [Coptis chinensis]
MNLSLESSTGNVMIQIYWGHGVYGIESASNFYFGKHPTVLNLGESAMLAGIIPAPELRSPFNEPSRGKTSQERALRRMVDAGFIDIEATLSTVNRRLYIHGDVSEHHTKVCNVTNMDYCSVHDCASTTIGLQFNSTCSTRTRGTKPVLEIFNGASSMHCSATNMDYCSVHDASKHHHWPRFNSLAFD